jgi:AhpD family alkylhydroperoxidase
MGAKTTIEELRDPTRAFRKAVPDTWKAFVDLHDAAMAPGALSPVTKELIALAIAVVKGCDGCIALHAKGAARRGASRQDVAEAIGVALLMDGGPASSHGPRALAAFDEFQLEAIAEAVDGS